MTPAAAVAIIDDFEPWAGGVDHRHHRARDGREDRTDGQDGHLRAGRLLTSPANYPRSAGCGGNPAPALGVVRDRGEHTDAPTRNSLLTARDVLDVNPFLLGVARLLA